jgi:hypothetical protein
MISILRFHSIKDLGESALREVSLEIFEDTNYQSRLLYTYLDRTSNGLISQFAPDC